MGTNTNHYWSALDLLRDQAQSGWLLYAERLIQPTLAHAIKLVHGFVYCSEPDVDCYRWHPLKS
jgi:hypothetical protein